MFRMDRATFGLPNWNLSQTQQDQFREQPSNVGRGLYREYNQTAPIPVTMQWTFDSVQMREFNDAWIDRTRFCWGAAWFLLDLPLGLDAGDAPEIPDPSPTGSDWSSAYSSAFVGDGAGTGSDWSSAYSSAFGSDGGGGGVITPQTIEVANTFQITVGTDGTSLGWTNVAYGSIEPNPPVIGETMFSEFRHNTSNDLMFLQPIDNAPIVGNETGIALSLPTSAQGVSKRYIAPWASGTTRYQFTVDDDFKAVWIDGASLPMIITAVQPLWRTYRVTPTGNRQTQMIAPDTWAVSMSVLVDVSQPTDWFAA